MKMILAMLAAALTMVFVPALAADDVPETTVSAPAQDTPTAGNNGYFARASELVIRALALIGVNYKYGGNSADSGLDCSGLVNLVFREVAGKVLPRDSRAMSNVGDKVDATGLQPGDLVFFNTLKRPFSHVGIYIGEERFIHAPSRGGEVSISNMRDQYWKKRYNGARRVSL